MDIRIEQATPEDFDGIVALDALTFAIDYSAEHIAQLRSHLDLSLFLLAREGDRTVGVAGEFPFGMTVPGGASLDVAGVTWVSVSPTDRGRGILRAMMERQLASVAARGLPMAALTATQYPLYGRYGYGVADFRRHLRVHRRATALRARPAAGQVQVVTTEQARAEFPAIHRRWAADTPGALTRSDSWWDILLSDVSEYRGSAGVLTNLLHPDGFASYRVESSWTAGVPTYDAIVTDFVAVTREAHLALWDVLLGMDLFATVTTSQLPADDPLPWLLTDARQIETLDVTDEVWLRPIDIERCLSARTYATEVDVVVDVSDAQFGDGRYRLTAGPDGADCRRTDDPAQLGIDVADLGSTYLGGVRLRELAGAGRIRVDDERALARLDLALTTDRAPRHGLHF